MWQTLVHIDQQVLLAINSWHSVWADNLMWIISGKLTWLPLYALLIGLLVWRFRRQIGRFPTWLTLLMLIVGFAVAVGGADMICHTLKHTICRLRPTHEPQLAGLLHTVRGYTGGQYGFPSSHAANTTACALLFALVWQRLIVTTKKTPLSGVLMAGLILWVVLNCYSRMYLGVHYPLDIIGGLIVGALCAGAVYYILLRLGRKTT